MKGSLLIAANIPFALGVPFAFSLGREANTF